MRTRVCESTFSAAHRESRLSKVAARCPRDDVPAWRRALPGPYNTTVVE